MKFARGYRPDPPGHTRTPLRHLAARLGAPALPDFTERSPRALQLSPVRDQSSFSGCTGCGTSLAVTVGAAEAGTPLGFDASDAAAYLNGRAIDRTPLPDGSLPPLVDGGAMPNQVWRGYAEFGARRMRPVADRYSELDAATINAEPTILDLEEESATLLVGEYGITSRGDQRIADLRTGLVLRPVTVAIQADRDGVQNYDGRALTASDLGFDTDHYVALVDFAIVQGRVIWLVRQSWGTKATSGWGVDAFTQEGVPPSWPAAGHMLLAQGAEQTFTDLVVADVRRA